MFFPLLCSATANLLLSAQRNVFSLTSSTCKKLNNDESKPVTIGAFSSAAVASKKESHHY